MVNEWGHCVWALWRCLCVLVTCYLGADLHVLEQYCQRLQIFCCPTCLHLCQLAVHLAEPFTVQPAHKHGSDWGHGRSLVTHFLSLSLKSTKTVQALLVFEIRKLFLKVGHLIQTFYPPSLAVLLIHFCNIMHTLTFGLSIMGCDRRQQKRMHRYTLADADSIGLNW